MCTDASTDVMLHVCNAGAAELVVLVLRQDCRIPQVCYLHQKLRTLVILFRLQSVYDVFVCV